MKLPLDHPTPDRPHRVYVALTNHCNRSCPWCSTCSSPAGSTWITGDQFAAALPHSGSFQLQLEGGEPTLHPRFLDFVAAARATGRCNRVVVCTNGVILPREAAKLDRWLDALGNGLTIKISVNHHLLDRDPGLLDLCRLLRDQMSSRGAGDLLVINVRLRRGVEDDDRAVREAVERAGLLPVANVFFLQRYGFASEESTWDPPKPVWDGFTLVNPDGAGFGPDLVARSEAMRRMS